MFGIVGPAYPGGCTVRAPVLGSTMQSSSLVNGNGFFGMPAPLRGERSRTGTLCAWISCLEPRRLDRTMDSFVEVGTAVLADSMDVYSSCDG